MRFEELDWAALDRLRATFLASARGGGSYWRSEQDLQAYDITFARRIAWKWEAVLSELDRLGWRPPGCDVVVDAGGVGDVGGDRRVPLADWGCGSGVATRCVRSWLGPAAPVRSLLWDRSAMAAHFAARRVRETFPAAMVEVRQPAPGSDAGSILLLSHVLNELGPEGLAEVLKLAESSAAVLWVEAGTRENSRALMAVREQLIRTHAVIAPCTHGLPCGMLTPGMEQHWCHFFAAPPPDIFSDSDWTRFAQRAGIDLRSLPYSYLVLEKAGCRGSGPVRDELAVRVVGEPRIYKGYARVFACGGGGLSECMLQKRDFPVLFREMKNGTAAGTHRMACQAGKVVSVQPWPADSGAAVTPEPC